MTAATEPARITIAALIPAFNAEATLARALDSVMAQTRRPDEIIVVDDGSRDGTAAIAAAYPSVRLCTHAANRGLIAALNTGLDALTAQWVAFLDADDEWLPEKLALQEAAARRQPGVQFITTGGHWLAEDGSRFGAWSDPPRWQGDEFWKTMLAENYCAKPAVMARMDAVRAVGGFTEPAPCDDLDMWLKLALAGPVAVVPQDLVRIHATPGSIMTRVTADAPLRMLAVIERHLAAARGRLTPAEERYFRACRQAIAGRTLTATGHRWQGFKLLARAALGGVDPLTNLWYAITNLPPLAAPKRWVRRIMR